VKTYWGNKYVLIGDVFKITVQNSPITFSNVFTYIPIDFYEQEKHI
jgi:hypothetical protein